MNTPTNPVNDEQPTAAQERQLENDSTRLYEILTPTFKRRGWPSEALGFMVGYLLESRSTPTPQLAVGYGEKRKELFNQVWQWFEENRFYSNWRTEDERDQWTAKDFQQITPENSAGTLAMEISYLVAGLMAWHKEVLTQATERAEVLGAAKAAIAICDELGLDLTGNGSYYLARYDDHHSREARTLTTLDKENPV